MWGRGFAIGAVGLVVALIGACISATNQPTASNLLSGNALATIQRQVTHIPDGVFDTVGTGGVQNPLQSTGSTEGRNGPGGVPEVLYIGAEFCPFCAAERWSLIAALSRFGELQRLRPVQSSATDVYPDTASLTFSGAKYTSQYVNLAAVETQTRERAPLQQPTPEQKALIDRYDPNGAIPFVLIGNRYFTVGSGYDPSLVNGKSWSEIAAGLDDASNPTTRAIVGNANYLTAAICQVTRNEPRAVCGSPAVMAVVSSAR